MKEWFDTYVWPILLVIFGIYLDRYLNRKDVEKRDVVRFRSVKNRFTSINLDRVFAGQIAPVKVKKSIPFKQSIFLWWASVKYNLFGVPTIVQITGTIYGSSKVTGALSGRGSFDNTFDSTFF